MAQSIKPTTGKRGRPSKADLEARKAAAAKADAMIAGAGSAPRGAPAPEPEKAAPAPKAKAEDKAPGFGHNAPDESVFLRHVHAIQQHREGPLAQAKEKLKEENGKLKDLRQLAKADGLVLKELDEAVEDARTERVDLVAKEERRRLYRTWLGLPMQQADLFEEDSKLPTLARDQQRWESMGNTDGRLARPRVSPEGCPPSMDSHYLAGWDKGQAALLRASPLTANAFAADGSIKPSAAAKADDAAPTTTAPTAPAEQASVLILGLLDFVCEGDLEAANRRTLANENLRERFDGAERVVAVFNGKRRILKEPGYVDDGEPETELSEVEPAAPEEVAATETAILEDLAEIEPDLVETVLADHGQDEDDDVEIPGEKPASAEPDPSEFN